MSTLQALFLVALMLIRGILYFDKVCFYSFVRCELIIVSGFSKDSLLFMFRLTGRQHGILRILMLDTEFSWSIGIYLC